MVLVLPKAETFGSKFAESLSSGLDRGIQSYERARDIKRERQGQYGALSSQVFSDLIKDASPEERAYFYKVGADLAKKNLSPQELFSKLTEEGVNYSNKVKRTEEANEPNRIGKFFTDPFTGDSKEAREKRSKAADKELHELPLARQRRLLADKGFAPEEVASRTSPLSKEASGFIKGLPDLNPRRKSKRGEQLPNLPENQKEYIGKELSNYFQTHPDADLLLTRKELMDKGVSWRDYRDMVDELEESGKIKVDPYYKENLHKPPLGPLRELLSGLGFVGR